MLEHFFQCPYCWEEISMILDPWTTNQVYIEDCEVCCNPVEISANFKTEVLTFFSAKSIEQ